VTTNATDTRRRLSDPEAESAVLGSLLVDPHERETVHDVFEILTPDDFDDKRNERVFRAVRAVWDQGLATEFVTVGDELEKRNELEEAGGREYLYSLVEHVPTSTNLLRYARIVREYSIRRRLSRTGNEIIELARNPPPADGENAVDKLLDLSEQKIFEIADREQAGAGKWLRETLKPAMERIDNIRDRNARTQGIPTGFLDLDDLTTGLLPGQLVIVAGRPGMGKTAFALNVALYAASHAKASIAVFSMEMSHQEITNRILCADAGVDSHALRTGRLPEDQLYLLSDAAGRLSAAPIWIDDSGTQTPFTLRARARRQLRSAKKLDLVIIDYLQLITQPGQESRVQEISAISRSLKALARELNVPVIALSQLNRSTEKEDRRPRLADLRESGSIEQDADIVMLLYREELYKKTEANAGRAEVIVAKQRNGPTDTIMLAFDSGATRFQNLAYGRGEGR
jgi:replicative DNA helicase